MSIKSKSGNIKIVIIVAIILLALVAFMVNKFILPRLVNTAVNKSVDAATEQLQSTDFSTAKTQQISENITTDGAIVVLSTNSGIVSFNSSAPSNTIIGTAQYFGNKPTIATEVKTDDATRQQANFLRINSQNDQPEKYDLHVPTNKPLGFIINIGAGIVNLNLSDSLTENILTNIGAGKIVITFSDKTSVETELNAGTGTIELSIPKNIGKNIVFSQGVPTNLELGADFIKTSSGFQSANYSTAEFKADITIAQGVGGFTINTIE